MSILWNFWIGFCLYDVICSSIALHLHFHNVSCIYMCVYMLHADRFGLGWTHDAIFFFFFARHMFMHLSCIRILSFPFLFSVVKVLFCLSLSISLSLSDRLCMVPKRKSTSSWNPLYSKTSSSDPTPLHVRFRDGKAHQDFFENFSKRGVLLERHMILSNFFDTTLPIVIHSQGWESLCEIPMSYPIMIIQEFYSNMHGFNTSIPHRFKVCVS